MTTLTLMITIPNIEKKYGHQIGDSKMPSTEEIVEAIETNPDHLDWLLEGPFNVIAEYV